MAVSILLLMMGVLHSVYGLVEYVVYPADKRDVTACSQINNRLIELLGNSKVQFYNSRIRRTTEFWLIQALEQSKATVLQIPGVRVLSYIKHFGNNDSRWMPLWKM